LKALRGHDPESLMQTEQKNDLKENILETADRLFLKLGVRSVSIDDLCGELRISKKTFYTVFPQKEALLSELLDRQLGLKTEKMMVKIRSQKFTVPDGHTPNAIDHLCNLDQLLSLSNLQFLSTTKDEDNFVYDLRKYYPDIHEKHLEDIHRMLSTHIRHGIHLGSQEGLFDPQYDNEMMAQLIACEWMACMRHIVVHVKKSSDRRQALQLLVHSQLNALCTDKGLTYYKQIIAHNNQNKE